jgi:hypothetical protein
MSEFKVISNKRPRPPRLAGGNITTSEISSDIITETRIGDGGGSLSGGLMQMVPGTFTSISINNDYDKDDFYLGDLNGAKVNAALRRQFGVTMRLSQ